MKKLIWIVIALIIGGYFVNSYLENRAKRNTEIAKSEQVAKVAKSAVAQLVSQYNAVDDWEKLLSKGESFRLEPIVTVELEKIWIVERPILFIGTIKDIASYNEENYTVLLEQGLFSSLDYTFDTELQLSLSSPKNKVDSFMKEHPSLFTDTGLNNGVAVVAKIRNIRTANVSGENGEREEIKIGEGELLEILYTGDAQF